jgi:asparagine synthase (glutamine-hydrolysing)
MAAGLQTRGPSRLARPCQPNGADLTSVCGIAGILRVDGGLVERDPLQRMIDALAHRGPDGSGIHIDNAIGLGHRRLSILDPTPAGAQPMMRGRNALVHNGEVYNYLELVAELRDHGERIDTGTDTEVMLAAYRVWGVDAVSRFNGMFAFALWDAERQRLLLARDRMGVKPLYLRRTGRSLAFASELSAFVAGRPLDAGDRWTPEPHLGAVSDFLVRGWTDHATATFLDGVSALPAAHLLIVELGTERLVRYWGPPQLADDDRPVVRGTDENRDARLVEDFRATFDSSVRLRLRSDVSIGTCLSGGLDSSSIVATVAELSGSGGGEVHAQVPRLGFHARFPEQGIDESPFAELVARQAGIRLVHTTPTGHPLLSVVSRVLRAQGEPYGGGSVNAQYAVMAAAHEEGIKVLLDGQGADELLGGYLPYLGLRSAGLVLSGRPIGAISELSAQVRRGPYSASGVLMAALNGGLPRGILEAIRDHSRGVFGIQCAGPLRRETASENARREPGTFLASRLWHAISTQGLPTLLRYEDRNSMAFGIEARVPFLDVRLVELAVRLPDRLRIDRGTTKVVLRRAMKGRLPASVAARRDKLGFAAPQQTWLADGQADVSALLRGGQIVQRGWVARGEVERVLAQGLSGGRTTEQLWRLFITEAWLRLLWPDVGGVVGRATWDAALAEETPSSRMAAVSTAIEAGDELTA